LNISPSYEWLPLLLLIQLHGQLLQRMSIIIIFFKYIPGSIDPRGAKNKYYYYYYYYY